MRMGMVKEVVTALRRYEILIKENGSENGLRTCCKNFTML